MKNLMLFTSLLVLCHCGEIPFTDEDTKASPAKPKIKVTEEKAEPDNFQTETVPPLPQDITDVPIENTETIDEQTAEEVPQEIPPEEPLFTEQEITLISEDLELTEDTVIKNRKVVLDMAQIKTHEHSLFIIVEEFHSNHSVIQNFPENKKARKKEHGKNGGSIQIEAEKAIGELQLILNGEKGGRVPRNKISKSERKRLKGKDGRDGQDAVYETVCRTINISSGFVGIGLPRFIPIRKCWDKCARSPRKGKNGKRGKRGLPGFDGKNGGDSGSFHLKAFDLSDFHLVNIQKIPGLGSKGGKGSLGGYGGDRGRNGRDRKGLCDRRLSRPKKGDKGRRGHRGKNGRDGNEGAVCLEKLVKTEGQTIQVSLETPATEKENVICY